jgi:outer membrane protein assembly factor BamB
MKIGISALLAVAVMCGSTALAQPADKAGLGSPGFTPTSERPIGWRGDGTGHYPGATPPTTWGIILNGPFGNAKYQAAKPAGDKPGPEALDFNVTAPRLTSFLILGPFPAGAGEPDAVLKQETAPDEAKLVGEEGAAVKDCKWKTGWFMAKDNKSNGFWTGANQVAYAHTYMYFEEAGSIDLSIEHQAGLKIWCNGKEVYADAKPYKYALGRANCRWFTMPIEKGWNRLLCKIVREGKETDGWFNLMGMPTKMTGSVSRNIQWVVDMPEYSFSTPVVVGDRLFTTAEPADLLCLDKATGKLLWVRSTLAWYAAEEDEKTAAAKEFSGDRAKIERLEKLNEDYAKDPAKVDLKARKALEKELVDWVGKSKQYNYHCPGWGGGNSAPTPCTDGKVIYAWHGEAGTLGCYALDGTRQWIRYIHPIGKGDGSHHGVNGSPVICGDMLIIPGWGCVIGVERATGKEVWNIKYDGRAYSTPVVDKLGGADVLILPTGAVVAVKDGKVLTPEFKGRYDGECASPAVDRAGRFFAVQNWGEMAIARTPDKADAAPAAVVGKIPAGAITYIVASPLFDNGLVYYVGNLGLLRVADTATGKLVYEKQLPLYPTISDMFGAGVAASLVKAGGNIYVCDNRGTTVVFAPGREYKQVAVNHLQNVESGGCNQEVFEGSPVMDGPRVFLRGIRRLYCIGPVDEKPTGPAAVTKN